MDGLTGACGKMMKTILTVSLLIMLAGCETAHEYIEDPWADHKGRNIPAETMKSCVAARERDPKVNC